MTPPAKKLPIGARRKSVSVPQGNLVRLEPLVTDQALPLLITPTVEGVNPLEWAELNRALVHEKLEQHGGILFRGFELAPTDVEGFIGAVSGGALRYTERSSPRSQVRGNIYTSTDHPSSQTIYLHNEQSYNLTFPRLIFFYSEIVAETGGETPIADSRRVYQRLDPAIRERFAAKQYMYVRNFGDGFGLTWQEAFQSEQQADVEAYCHANQISFEWKGEGRLRTRQVRPAIARHPRTGEMTWFNHATFFHVTTLEPALRDRLLAAFSEEELPNNTFYGDGTPIEPEVLEALRAAYAAETITFPWQKGDLLMLDNMLVAHARSPYTGARKVVVGMAEPLTWDSVRPLTAQA